MFPNVSDIVWGVPDRSQHLADRVEARRVELGYTITALMDATGLTQQALKNVRTGERRKYQDRLTLPLTAALRWTPDSIDRLLRGEEPIELATSPSNESTRLAKVERVVRSQAQVTLLLADAAIDRLGEHDELVSRLDELEEALAALRAQ